jgi:hypothetical protein
MMIHRVLPGHHHEMIRQGLGENGIGTARHFVIVDGLDVVLTEALHGLFQCLDPFGIGNARGNGCVCVVYVYGCISLVGGKNKQATVYRNESQMDD